MIAFCWRQLPVYAARCIKRFVQETNEEVVVLVVPTNRFPIKGAEKQTGCRVIQVDHDDGRSLSDVAGKMPKVLLVGGWSTPSFLRWTKEVRRSGGKTILCTDEPFIDRSIKQRIRMVRFKLFLNRLYDRIFICGGGGIRQFADWYGLPRKKLFTGLYASDPELFFNGAPLQDRAKRFLFVGHFDTNKNVLPMCAAFLRVHERHPDWELEICGGGELEKEIPREPGILFTGFVQAEHLGEKYRGARCLVLGSFKEKWGVVVHEAAASGCLLLLSTSVGAKDDFARPENSALFDPASEAEMEAGMEKLIAMTPEELEKGQARSVELARTFSPEIFASNLKKALSDLDCHR